MPDGRRFALVGLRVTGFGLSLLAATHAPGALDAIHTALTSPVAARSLVTMSAGAFRGYLRGTGPSFDGDMVDVVRSGVRAGAAASSGLATARG